MTDNNGTDQTRGIVFLHVTHKKNQASIQHEGVLPERSQGKRMWSYYCTIPGILRVCAHVAQRNKCLIDDLVVFAVEVSATSIKRTRYPYYFGSDEPGRPIAVFTPKEVVDWAGDHS
jgi:hypothetical protein